ncbi:hypothetical protein D3C87_1063570 [compost metagenome]
MTKQSRNTTASAISAQNHAQQRVKALNLLNKARGELVDHSTLQHIIELLAVSMTKEFRWEMPSPAQNGLLRVAWVYLNQFDRSRIARSVLYEEFGRSPMPSRTARLGRSEYKVPGAVVPLRGVLKLRSVLSERESQAVEAALHALTDDSPYRTWDSVASAIDRLWLAGVGLDILNYLRKYLLDRDPYDPTLEVPFALLPEEIKAVDAIGKWWR